MPTFVYRPDHPKANENGFVDRNLVWADGSEGPNVISDTMPETRHMADGQYYTSKSKFREATKAAGCVEIGNETNHVLSSKPVQLDRAKRRDDIRRTIYELRNGSRY